MHEYLMGTHERVDLNDHNEDYAYLYTAVEEVLESIKDDQLNLASQACRDTLRDAIVTRIINDFEEEETNGKG